MFGNILEIERNRIVSNVEKTTIVINNGSIRVSMRTDSHDKEITLHTEKLLNIETQMTNIITKLTYMENIAVITAD